MAGMSAILSADDLNDFITPGVACIKPVETLPSSTRATDSTNAYEVTTEDKIQSTNLPAAQISLTDCLACSGCVTSAEAVLVSLQSHAEVFNTLNSYRSIKPEELRKEEDNHGMKIFVASVSPQTRASLAAAYGVSEKDAGNMIQQMLSSPQGIRIGTVFGSDFLWVIDTNVAREACLVLGADEVMDSMGKGGMMPRDNGAGAATATNPPQQPVLTSACPGWICYAEKTHPHVLRHLSRLKSPQALLGTLIKTTISRILDISPENIWHLAIMPCFDKKLEASREELTDVYWRGGDSEVTNNKGIRDVDCVITTKELLLLADSTGINFSHLPRDPLSPTERTPFPDPMLHNFLFSSIRQSCNTNPAGGTSGGYLYHILETFVSQNPGSQIHTQRGRNSDVVEHQVIRDDGQVILKTARYYGFRNIQNLVRKLKPPKTSRMPVANRKKAITGNNNPSSSSTEYTYIEVMACPGGCTNGGGQIKIDEVASIQSNSTLPTAKTTTTITTQPSRSTPADQRKWLNQVDEAYFSSSSPPPSSPSSYNNSDPDSEDELIIGEISHPSIHSILHHWSELTNIPLEKLVYTSYRAVESDVGKGKDTMMAVEGLAGKIGGGW